MGGGVGGSFKRKGIYIHLQLIHIVTHRNQHNTLKQLSSSLKREKRKGEGEGGAIFPLFPSFLKFFRLAIKHFYYAH